MARFRRVLESAMGQASRVIIIDNASSNADSIRGLCRGACEFLEVSFNSGVAHALKIGVRHASRYDAEWLLFLDDDTILFEGAVDKALRMVTNYLRPLGRGPAPCSSAEAMEIAELRNLGTACSPAS